MTKNKSTQKLKYLIPSGIGIFLLLLYLIFAFYFSSHYYFNTKISGYSCGGKKATAVIDKNTKTADSYILTLRDRMGSTYGILGSDISYTYVPIGEEESIIKGQKPFAWPTNLFREHEYTLTSSITYDEDALKKLLMNLQIFDDAYIQAPVDASFYLSEDGYGIVPEEPGNTPIFDTIFSEVSQALHQQDLTYTLTNDCYVSPNLTSTSKELTDKVQQVDSYLASTIHYAITKDEDNLTSEQIYKFLSLDEQGNIQINKEKVDKFVQSLAYHYNTYGSEREFKTTKGDTITIGGGDYGWIVDKPAEAEQIIADLNGGTAVSREPVFYQRAQAAGPNDITDTYIEIDYTNQHLWYYKEGVLKTDFDVVTGNLSQNNGSPDGVFYIKYKQQNATLIGEDYTTPVNYFMVFAYNVGIHDASWRPNFGGTIYKTSGSHGCVNASPSDAATLYDMLDEGTIVVAYYRDSVQLKSENANISNAYSKAPVEKEEDKKDDKNTPAKPEDEKKTN